MKVFWDVDTQHDFMDAEGALSVPKAKSIRKKLEALTLHAIEKQIPVLGSVDCHTAKDKEFEIFPPHCVKGTEGADKIDETSFGADGIEAPTFIPNKKFSKAELSEMIQEAGNPWFFFQKQSVNVFDNPNVIQVLKLLGITEAAVYGVATEYCVKAAVLGLIENGIGVYLVQDAIKGIEKDKEKEAMEEMITAGVSLTTTDEIIASTY